MPTRNPFANFVIEFLDISEANESNTEHHSGTAKNYLTPVRNRIAPFIAAWEPLNAVNYRL